MPKFSLETASQRLTAEAASWLREALFEGAFAVDATVGNGFDSLFLAHQVGKTGTVLGFDVQKRALGDAREMLKFAGTIDRARFIHDSHSHLENYIEPDQLVHGAMFNLGYLPRGDRRIITRPETTILALQAVLRHLTPGGRITVLAYRGHEGGTFEYIQIRLYLEELSAEFVRVEELAGSNDSETAPRLFRILKRPTVPE
ncbi:MAG: class I SAM-dependent methyltransferase [Verrucomicrobia bacterium]|nr:class I SAM-dependent methyltransferase [Verrucomicrobiota bacterium]